MPWPRKGRWGGQLSIAIPPPLRLLFSAILDLLLPVMDGMTVLDRLCASPHHAGLPVIVVTGKELTPREREELAEKASGVIAKGEGVEERLKEALRSLFSLGHAHR